MVLYNNNFYFPRGCSTEPTHSARYEPAHDESTISTNGSAWPTHDESTVSTNGSARSAHDESALSSNGSSQYGWKPISTNVKINWIQKLSFWNNVFRIWPWFICLFGAIAVKILDLKIMYILKFVYFLCIAVESCVTKLNE